MNSLGVFYLFACLVNNQCHLSLRHRLEQHRRRETVVSVKGEVASTSPATTQIICGSLGVCRGDETRLIVANVSATVRTLLLECCAFLHAASTPRFDLDGWLLFDMQTRPPSERQQTMGGGLALLYVAETAERQAIEITVRRTRQKCTKKKRQTVTKILKYSVAA
jgi:hypothetical protein